MNVLINHGHEAFASRRLDLDENRTEAGYVSKEEIAGRYKTIVVSGAGALAVWGIYSVILA